MKKLIIAVASALGFAFYANAAAEATIGSTFTAELLPAGPLNITEDEDGDDNTAGSLYWTADGATEDSTVTPYDNEKNVKPTGDYVNADVGDQFLAVDQSDVLNRHFLDQNGPNSDGVNPHGPVSIGNGLYIDTMVQFTAADTAPEATLGEDKLIVWLQEVEAAEAIDETPAVEPATNLVVTAGYYNNGVLERKDYVISKETVTVNPNEWYRLTIRAIPDIGNETAGFIVYINENPVAVGPDAFGITVSGAETALIEAGAVFPSLTGRGLNAAQTLTSVGFKGTGKIDNLSLSDANPDFIVLNNNYTVTWDEGVVSFKYKYEIGDEVKSGSISTADYTAEKKCLIELGTAWPTITFTEIVYDSANGYEAYGDIIANKAITTGADSNTCRIGAVQKLFVVGDNKYATIDGPNGAIANANGNTIKLNADIVVSSIDDALSITDNIVLDLAGKKIRSTGELYPVSLEYGATLTVIDSVGTGEIIGGDNGSIYMSDEGGHVKIGLADPTSDGITDKGATIRGEINTDEASGEEYGEYYSISVVQGKMDWNPTNYVDSDISTITEPQSEGDLYTVTLKGDEPSVVYVAQIGEVEYESLAEAIAAAGAEDEVVVIADIATDAAFEITKKVAINLNGKTIATTQADTEGNGVFWVKTGGDLTLNGEGTVNGVGGNACNIAIWADGGKVTINDGTYTNVGAQDDGPDGAHFDLIYVKHGGSVVINGGTFTCETPRWTLNIKNGENQGTITVNGGKFFNFNPADCDTDDFDSYCAEGFLGRLGKDGYYTVEQGKKITYASAQGEVPVAKYVLSGYELTQDDLPELTATGYVFGGWDKAAGTSVTANMTITATWTAVPTEDEHDIIIKNDVNVENLSDEEIAEVKEQIVALDEAVGGHEKVSAYFTAVYGDAKVPASLVRGTTPDLFKISEKFSLPLLVNEPTVMVAPATSTTGAPAFEFTLMDGQNPVAVIESVKTKQLVKYVQKLGDTFSYNEDELAITFNNGKIKVDFKKTGKSSGFMMVDFKVD